MIAKVNVKVGLSTYQFEVEEADDKVALQKITTLGSPPRICNVCSRDEITLGSNKDKEGNIYINVICLNSKCGAKAKLGLYKTGGYFWHEFERWQGPLEPDTEEPDQEQERIHQQVNQDIQAPRQPKPANPPNPPARTIPLNKCHFEGCELDAAADIPGFCSADHKTKYWGKKADDEEERRKKFEFDRKEKAKYADKT